MTRQPRILIFTQLLTLVALFFVYDRWQKTKDKNARQESVIREKSDSISYWQNKHGQVVAEKHAAEVTAQELDDFYKEEIKLIKDEFNIKQNDLKAFVKAEFAAMGEGTTTINNHYHTDSTGTITVSERTFDIADGYLSLAAVLDSTKVSYNYTYQDEILYAFHTKKKWVFGKEELYGSGRLTNPNAKITNSTSVLVDDYKDKRWVVSAGVSWLPLNPDQQFWPAVHVGYALLKF